MGDSFADFSKPIDARDVMASWAAATQERNLESLQLGAGPGGAEIASNKPYTIRRKGHDRPGFGKTGAMANGLVSPDALGGEIDRRGGKLKIFPGDGSTDVKVNKFLSGHDAEKIDKKARRENGGEKRWERVIPAVPGRDFIGIDERDVDDAGEHAMETLLEGWGFK